MKGDWFGGGDALRGAKRTRVPVVRGRGSPIDRDARREEGGSTGLSGDV